MALGIPVGELLERMDARELTDWAAFERLEPFGERTMQLMIAQLTALVASALQEKGKPALKAEDLLPRYVEEPEDVEVPWRQLKKRMMALTQTAQQGAAAKAVKRKRG